MHLEERKHRVVELLADGRLRAARDLAWRAKDEYPRRRALAAAWVAETLCRLDEPETALAVLREAVDAGVWWWEQILRVNPPLTPIHGRPEFEEIVVRAEALRERGRSDVAPIIYRPDSAPAGVLVPLHGRSDHHLSFARRWEPARKAGFLVVVPHSQEATTSDGDIGWIDEAMARRQIVTIHSRLADGERRLPVVLAGYSQGARIAADWSLTGILPEVAGFVTLCPPDDRMPAVAGRNRAAAAPRIRGYILTGEHDDDRPGAERFAAELTANRIPVVLDVMSGMGHGYPPDFGERLCRAVSFVIGGGAPESETGDSPRAAVQGEMADGT
jgi:predicted esterase